MLTRDHTVLPAIHTFIHKWNEHTSCKSYVVSSHQHHWSTVCAAGAVAVPAVLVPAAHSAQQAASAAL